MIVFAFDPGATTGLCILDYDEKTNQATLTTTTLDLEHFNPFSLLTVLAEFYLSVIAERLEPDMPMFIVVEDVVKTGRLNTDKVNQILAFDRAWCIGNFFQESEELNATLHVVTPEQRKHLGIKVPKIIKIPHEKDAFKHAVLGLALAGVDANNVEFIFDD